MLVTSYLRKSSSAESPPKRYIAEAADPSMFIVRCDTSAGGMCGEGPHIAGRPVLSSSALTRENEVHSSAAGVVVSSRSLTTRGAIPPGWIELLYKAAEAIKTHSTPGCRSTGQRLTESSDIAASRLPCQATRKQTAAAAPIAPTAS